MKSDQSNQTKPSSKDSEIEDLVEAFTNNLPVQATEIGWEQIGEEQQDFIKSIDQYTQSKLKAFAGEIEKAIGEDNKEGDPVAGSSIPMGFTESVLFNELRAELRQALKAIKEKYQL